MADHKCFCRLNVGRGILRAERIPPCTQVEILDARKLSAADARAIAELIVKVWPKPDKPVEYRTAANARTWVVDYTGPDDQAPRSFLIRDRERVIAHAASIPRIIGTTAGDMTIAGLCRVCTDPDFRGQGLGEFVVAEVFKLVDESVFPFSLFQTNQIQLFYEKLGACVVTNRFVNSQASDLTLIHSGTK